MLWRHLWRRNPQCTLSLSYPIGQSHGQHQWTYRHHKYRTPVALGLLPVQSPTNLHHRIILNNGREKLKHAKNLSTFSHKRYWDFSVFRTLEEYRTGIRKFNTTHGRKRCYNVERDGARNFTSKTGGFQAPRTDTRQQRRASVKVVHLTPADCSHSESDDYRGICPPLLPEWRPMKDTIRSALFPWLSSTEYARPNDGNEPAVQRLTAEISACEKYLSPNSYEQLAADKAFNAIKKAIHQSVGDDAVVDLIGSRAANTNGPLSDLDINVTLCNTTEAEDFSGLTVLQLRDLDNHIRNSQFRDDLLPHVFLRKAHIPVIVGTHLQTGLEFQIQSTNFAYDSLEVTRAFLAEYPTAGPLFRIIKQMLQMRGLTQGVSGGLTSYPLLNMVIISLKLSDPCIIHDDVASQLLFFLKYWSEFQFEKERIVLRDVGPNNPASGHNRHGIDPISSIPQVVRKPAGSAGSAYAMSLQDPANRQNDLGKNVHSIKHVQACLREALKQIRNSMQVWNRHPSSYTNTSDVQEPILAWCLGGNYTGLEEARWQLRRYL